MLFQADPYGLENSIFLKNGRDQDIQHYLSDLKKLLSYIPEDCPIYILVIPHCIQINTKYRDRMLQLGAQLEFPDNLFEINFPFYRELQSAFNKKHLHFINSLPHLQQQALLNILYYENDPHLNTPGHRVLGQHMVKILQATGKYQ